MPDVVRPLAVIVAAGLVAMVATPATGHVQPSVDANNRYLKLSPMGDRVRLAYTVLFGERPGAAMRRRLDRDRDGQIDAGEGDVLGRELAAALAPALHLAIDGQPVRWSWAQVDVGLGTPTTTGGSLSVDLIAWICAPAGADHQLTLRDDYSVDAAGDSELRVEAGPGIHLGARTLGGEPMPGLEAAWTGKGGPITTGFELRYQVDAQATRPRDGRCQADRPAARRPRWPWLVALAVALAAALGLAAAFAWSRRRR